ncbi:hypothetical protein IZY60_02210 [Lutibacter sp. B2]|nr:hypothetical protein [Lutibacter sp. B2]
MKFKQSKLILILVVIALIIGGILYKVVFYENYTYNYTYISAENNKIEKEQINAIETMLKDNGCNYEKTQFDMLSVDDKKNFVIRNSEYNKLAKSIKLEKVKLKENEAFLIPGYDLGIRKFGYTKEIKGLKKIKVTDKELDVVGVSNKRIPATGRMVLTSLFKSQVVVSDNLYEKLQKNSESKIVKVYGYNFSDERKAQDMTRKLEENKLFKYDSENKGKFHLLEKE